ncbi:hypothetical protein ACIPY6_28615 [Streptomyces sp. NPDC090054]|uniref:hypothetical protein n=1 Tax=Streptomyces sp. NPDC090054 TaxID=3365933 RepID=UPI00381AD24C
MTEIPVLGPFAPLPAPPTEAAAAEADTILASARAEAARITDEAATRSTSMIASADSQARRVRALADSEARKTQKRSADIDTWSARIVTAAAVGLTASGEYELARKVGFDKQVAWLLPVVIDVYVIQAFRRHRDIVPAIGLTVATNVIYHLADAGLFGVKNDGSPKWWLIAIVASIASLILWRMHCMMAPAEARQRRVRKTQPPASESQANIVLTVDEEPSSDPASDGPEERQKQPVPEPRNGATTGSTRGRQRAARKAAKVRRSMTEWVAVAEPIFHAEFTRLRRNPTADEFATAIAKSGLGTVGTTTAKNIRAEILDRADVPALTD